MSGQLAGTRNQGEEGEYSLMGEENRTRSFPDLELGDEREVRPSLDSFDLGDHLRDADSTVWIQLEDLDEEGDRLVREGEVVAKVGGRVDEETSKQRRGSWKVASF